jgi:hypothetical protein
MKKRFLKLGTMQATITRTLVTMVLVVFGAGATVKQLSTTSATTQRTAGVATGRNSSALTAVANQGSPDSAPHSLFASLLPNKGAVISGVLFILPMALSTIPFWRLHREA